MDDISDKRLERIETKVDDISDHLGAIDVTLGAQHVTLREHIRRTKLLEEKLVPVEKHVNLINSISKIVTFLAGVGSLIAIILKLMKVL